VDNPSAAPQQGSSAGGRLDSWKEIASYLKRGVRSVQRWEAEEGMPVHRHLHEKRGTVYAFPSELDAWWKERGSVLAEQNGADEAEPLEAEPAEAAPAAEPVVSLPRKSRRVVWAAVGFATAVLLVGVGAWLSRNGLGPAARSPRSLAFRAREWVLVAGFENRTGEKLFDGTLDYALGRELSNSRFVNVVPRERIGDALRLMRKPLDTRVDAVIGREICLRDGDIRALITGRIERLGPKYILSVELVNPSQGVSIASVAEETVRHEELLPATRRISDWVRAKLGENPLLTLQGEGSLLKVTTPSLRALQLYSQADILIAQGNSAAAEELLRQAVAEDPNFASAYIHLAHAINNQKRPMEGFRPHAETALRLSESTTERERYFIRGSYYDLLGQREKAIAAYEALLSLYPDHFWGTTNLWGIYHSQGRFRDAVELEVRRADLRPRDFRANYDAASDLAPLDRARSRLYVERARALLSPSVMQSSDVAWLELFPAAEDWLDGNLTGALQVADGLSSKIDSLSGNARTGFAMGTAHFYLTLGRLEAAAQCFQKIRDPLLRQEQLARVAFFRNDRRALKRHLVASDGTTYQSVNSVILLARVGLLPQAARLLNKIETEQSISTPGYLQIPRGELALARGEVDRGIAELEEGTRRVGEMGHQPSFLGSESLAAALKEKGDLAQAVQVLERASEKRPSAAFQLAGAFWLRNQFQLAQLYREVGRAEDARKIERELLNLLALADLNHPILRELQQLRNL
jgi:tetratricopeptide (TPR) repeat protein